MAGVNVSREALTGVKTALNQFKTEIAGVPFSMQKDADMLQSECEEVIRKVESQISSLELQIIEKKAQLKQLQSDLNNAKCQLQDTGSQKTNTEWNLVGIDREIKSCEKELLSLRAQLSLCNEIGDGSEGKRLQQAVFGAESRLITLKYDWSKAATEHQNQKKMIYSLTGEIKKIEAAILDTESDLCDLRGKLSLKKSKRNRLGMAFDNLKSELNVFTNSVRRFTECALTQTQQDITSVDQCIQYIDDYLATNL